MSILDDLKSLDPNDPGRWPLPVRVGTVVLCFVLLSAALFYFVVYKDQKPELTAATEHEEDLRKTFKDKHSKAVNLAVYQQQLADIERSFGALLRQLPGRTEVPNLLVDISQVGVGAGLEEKLFQPANEVKKDFYAELPIKIKLTGSYHQMGEFVSGIAALPRIVTLHDITIKPDNKDAVRRAVVRADREDLPLSRRRRSRRREEQGRAGGEGQEVKKSKARAPKPSRHPSANAKTQVMDMFSKSKKSWLLVAGVMRPLEHASRPVRARTMNSSSSSTRRRRSRVAASSRCPNSSPTNRMPTSRRACARRSCRAVPAGRARCARIRGAIASSSNSSRSIRCAWSARCAWPTARTGSSRQKMASFIACCPEITWGRPMAGSPKSRLRRSVSWKSFQTDLAATWNGLPRSR